MILTSDLPEGAYIPMWSPDTSSTPRRGILRRAVFSEEQRKELEKTFKRQKYISKIDRNKLAADLNLKESQVGYHILYLQSRSEVTITTPFYIPCYIIFFSHLTSSLNANTSYWVCVLQPRFSKYLESLLL